MAPTRRFGRFSVSLWTYDVQYALPSLAGGPPYYWTNCYHWQQSDVATPDATILNHLATLVRSAIPGWLTLVGVRVTSPGGVQTYPTSPAFVPGSAPLAGLSGSPACIIRAEYWASGRLRGYKRIRACYDAYYYDNKHWSADVLGYYRSVWVPRNLAVPLCSAAGVLFDAVTIRSEIFSWQIRHGSKRATRAVFVAP